MIRADKEAMPAMRNRPQKLSRLRLPEETWVLELEQLLWSPNHAFSISFIFSPSVTFNIAQETSDTKGEPFGKTWETLKKEKKKKGKKKKLHEKLQSSTNTYTWERERERAYKTQPIILIYGLNHGILGAILW